LPKRHDLKTWCSG
jgi:hypothetical protein